MLIRVQLNASATQTQIEVPASIKVNKKEKTLKRSKADGSLHFLPGRVKSVTQDEFDYLKSFKKDLFGNLRVVGTRPAKPKVEKTVEKKPSKPKTVKDDK